MAYWKVAYSVCIHCTEGQLTFWQSTEQVMKGSWDLKLRRYFWNSPLNISGLWLIFLVAVDNQ